MNLNDLNYQSQQLQYKNIELLCNIDMWKKRLQLLYDIYVNIKPINDVEETGRYNKDIFILDGCIELYDDINQLSSSSLLQQQQQTQHQLFNNSSLIVNTNSTTTAATTTTDNANVQHNNNNNRNHHHYSDHEIITNSLLNESNIEQINLTNNNKINTDQDVANIGKSRVFMSVKPSDLEVFMAKDKVLHEALKEFKGKEGLILVPKQDNEGYSSSSGSSSSSSSSSIETSMRNDGNNINNHQTKNTTLRSAATAPDTSLIPDTKTDTAAESYSTTTTVAVSEQNMMQWIVLNVSD